MALTGREGDQRYSSFDVPAVPEQFATFLAAIGIDSRQWRRLMLNIEKGALGRWVRRGQVWPVWEKNGRPVGGVRPKQARDFAWRVGHRRANFCREMSKAAQTRNEERAVTTTPLFAVKRSQAIPVEATTATLEALTWPVNRPNHSQT